MIWQNQNWACYINCNEDPTNPLTIKDGQGWKFDYRLGKEPLPRFEEVTQQEQVRTSYH
jgi:hypothetical protein